MAEWIKKSRSNNKTVSHNRQSLYKTHFTFKDTHKPRAEGWRKKCQANVNQSRSSYTYIRQIDFQLK